MELFIYKYISASLPIILYTQKQAWHYVLNRAIIRVSSSLNGITRITLVSRPIIVCWALLSRSLRSSFSRPDTCVTKSCFCLSCWSWSSASRRANCSASYLNTHYKHYYWHLYVWLRQYEQFCQCAMHTVHILKLITNARFYNHAPKD